MVRSVNNLVGRLIAVVRNFPTPNLCAVCRPFFPFYCCYCCWWLSLKYWETWNRRQQSTVGGCNCMMFTKKKLKTVWEKRTSLNADLNTQTRIQWQCSNSQLKSQFSFKCMRETYHFLWGFWNKLIKFKRAKKGYSTQFAPIGKKITRIKEFMSCYETHNFYLCEKASNLPGDEKFVCSGLGLCIHGEKEINVVRKCLLMARSWRKYTMF